MFFYACSKDSPSSPEPAPQRTITFTLTSTITETGTATFTHTFTPTHTITMTSTQTPTYTHTSTPTETATFTPTFTTTNTPLTLRIKPLPDDDGQVFSNYTSNNNNVSLEVGDNSANIGIQGLLSFNLPENISVIKEARFRIMMNYCEGSPFF